MLRAVGAGAGAGLFAFGAVSTAVAELDPEESTLDVSPDCECYYQTYCNTDQLCDDPTLEYPYDFRRRECCECDEGRVCDDWNSVSCCSG